MNQPATILELKETFKRIKNSTYNEIKGVLCIESGRTGPCIGITTSTHGNEPSGLAVIHHLLNLIRNPSLIRCGKLYLIINNLEATQNYFLATNEVEERAARFVDVNMNRLPIDVLDLKNDCRSEILRTQALYPIWKEFTHALDIHSTLREISPMIIARRDGLPDDLIRGIEIPTILTNIDKIQIGLPAFAFYGGLHSSAHVFAIEVGSHKNPDSFKRAIDTTLKVLTNIGMIENKIVTSPRMYKEYYIDGSILFPDLSYTIPDSHEVADFEFISKGTILGKSNEKPDICAPFDGHPLLMVNPSTERELKEEVMFLSRPVTVRVI